IHASWPVQDIPSRVAVNELCRRRKRGRVEPAVDRRGRQSAVADAVWGAARPGIDRRRVQRRREWKTCLECVDAVDLPPAGQRVVPSDGQTMTDTERGAR